MTRHRITTENRVDATSQRRTFYQDKAEQLKLPLGTTMLLGETVQHAITNVLTDVGRAYTKGAAKPIKTSSNAARRGGYNARDAHLDYLWLTDKDYDAKITGKKFGEGGISFSVCAAALSIDTDKLIAVIDFLRKEFKTTDANIKNKYKLMYNNFYNYYNIYYYLYNNKYIIK